MKNQVLETIAARRSHRRYLPDQLSQEQLEAIMEAMMQSPSANNRQPWHFSVVQDEKLLRRVHQATRKQVETLPEGKRSPRFADPDYDVLYKAPTVIFISAPEATYSPIDCGIAVQTIALAAESLGLGSVIVGMARMAFEGEDRAELEKALKFPEGHRFYVSICLGTPDDDKAAPEQQPGRISLIT